MLAYFDCPTGISGDMCLGALVDAGVALQDLAAPLASLGLADEYELRTQRVVRNGQAATKVDVVLAAERAPHRHLADIQALISGATLPQAVQERSLRVFQRLAEAEGAVHGIEPERVHFHEVGATDALVDIVGTCLGLHLLGVSEIYCSALPTGGGRVRAAHGWLPVPAPAVLRLMQMAQVPIYSNGIEKELVTPTGVAIATTLAQRFGPPPPMVLKAIGLGAGGRDLPLPNILRLWLGEPAGEMTAHSEHAHSRPAPPTPAEIGTETVTVLETQIDDISPQAVGYLYDRLFAVGALDVFYQGIGMKKSRPGFLITVICSPQQVLACEQVLFAETTTLGVRRHQQQRRALRRTHTSVATPYGAIRLKLAFHPQTQALLNVQPEYEDCAALARQHQVPWLQVHRAALVAWQPNSETAPTAAGSLGTPLTTAPNSPEH